MLHPDYQYSPKLIPAMVAMITSGHYDVILASRILSGGALKGMPLYKYVANRLLTFTQNLFMGLKLSEYHTGYRAFRSDVLQSIDFESNSDDFIFDNQLLAQIASKVCYRRSNLPHKIFQGSLFDKPQTKCDLRSRIFADYLALFFMENKVAQNTKSVAALLLTFLYASYVFFSKSALEVHDSPYF